MARWTDITAHLANSPKLLGFDEASERTARALVATGTGHAAPILLDNRYGDWLHIVTPLTLAAKRFITKHGTPPGMSLTRWDGEWVLHQGIYQPDTTVDIVLSAVSATADAANPYNATGFFLDGVLLAAHNDDEKTLKQERS